MPGAPALEQRAPKIGELARLSAAELLDGYGKGIFTSVEVIE